MSYWIGIEGVALQEAHHEIGGTYALGGTTEASLNVTYNYAKLFNFRQLDKVTVISSLPLLLVAIAGLDKDKTDPDYWKCTEGNVRRCLVSLFKIGFQAVVEGHTEDVWYVH